MVKRYSQTLKHYIVRLLVVITLMSLVIAGFIRECLERADRIILNLLKPVVFAAADSGGINDPGSCIGKGVNHV